MVRASWRPACIYEMTMAYWQRTSFFFFFFFHTIVNKVNTCQFTPPRELQDIWTNKHKLSFFVEIFSHQVWRYFEFNWQETLVNKPYLDVLIAILLVNLDLAIWKFKPQTASTERETHWLHHWRVHTNHKSRQFNHVQNGCLCVCICAF